MEEEPSSARRQSDISELTRLLSQCSTQTECLQHERDECERTATSSPIPIPKPAPPPPTHIAFPGGSPNLSAMFARLSASGMLPGQSHSPAPGECPGLVCVSRVQGSEPRQCPPRNHTIVQAPPAQSMVKAAGVCGTPPARGDHPVAVQEDLPKRPDFSHRTKVNAETGTSQKPYTEAITVPEDISNQTALPHRGPWGSDYSPFGSSPISGPQIATTSGSHHEPMLCGSSCPNGAITWVVGGPGMELAPSASGLSGALFSLDEDLEKGFAPQNGSMLVFNEEAPAGTRVGTLAVADDASSLEPPLYGSRSPVPPGPGVGPGTCAPI